MAGGEKKLSETIECIKPLITRRATIFNFHSHALLSRVHTKQLPSKPTKLKCILTFCLRICYVSLAVRDENHQTALFKQLLACTRFLPSDCINQYWWLFDRLYYWQVITLEMTVILDDVDDWKDMNNGEKSSHKPRHSVKSTWNVAKRCVMLLNAERASEPFPTDSTNVINQQTSSVQRLLATFVLSIQTSMAFTNLHVVHYMEFQSKRQNMHNLISIFFPLLPVGS